MDTSSTDSTTPSTPSSVIPVVEAPAPVAKQARQSKQVYIVRGEVNIFKNVRDAEKYLNEHPDAPREDFTVIRGNEIEQEAQRSVRLGR
jgi:hypothetical protein